VDMSVPEGETVYASSPEAEQGSLGAWSVVWRLSTGGHHGLAA
jgi:hypothetical protein